MELEKKLLDLSNEFNGLMTTKQLYEQGFTKRQIKNLENNNFIERISKGIYLYKDTFKDELKILQLENNRFVYSNETAAYLHDLTDRYPRYYSITTYSGYHLRKSGDLKVYYVKKDLLDLGVCEIKNNAGNLVKVYDKERTLCDFIKNKNRIELQVYTEVIQNYFKGKVKLNKITKYANQLGISSEVSIIVQLMMKQ